MKRVVEVFLGILTAIGGFVDIGDLVANAETGARFRMGLAWAVVVGQSATQHSGRSGGT